MAVLLPHGKQKFTTATGAPGVGYKLYTYIPGTTTPKATFRTYAGTTANTNPVIADSRGEMAVYWSGNYDVVLKDANNVTIWGPERLEDGANNLQSDLASTSSASNGAGDIGYNAALVYPNLTVGGKLNQSITPEDFGAYGNGIADDTTAVQTAINTGKAINFTPGKTYLVGALTQNTPGQIFVAYGATLKRTDSSAHAAILTLTSENSCVYGGSWDGNKANQSGTGDDKYEHAAVTITADFCKVIGIKSFDSWGLGIKAKNCSYVSIAGNIVVDHDTFGIYVESTESNEYGNEITNNLCISSDVVAAGGIYITGSNSPFTYKQYLWKVTGNTCRGSVATPTGVGITTRGVDGVIANNMTTGFTMGISADIASRTTITGNRCSEMAGAIGYGIELNGERCVVTGNYVKGGRYGLAASGNSTPQDYSNISGNIFEEPTVDGIYFVATGSYSAQHLNISDNVVTFTGSGTNRACVRLAGNCKYSHITGNKLVGPGKAISGCRAVYLDSVDSDISMIGNRISGFERPVTVYKGSAQAYTNIVFNDNDCTLDMNSDDTFIANEGSATIGANCVQKNNAVGSGYARHYESRGSNILELTGAGSPEGAITAGIGSRYWRTDGTATTTLYIKGSGVTNTGWTALT